MDPGALAGADPSTMDFGPGRSKPKSWKEIWGAGQGIGAVHDVLATADLVDRFAREYEAAQRRTEALIAAHRDKGRKGQA